jgi:hypothetical protein
MGGLCGAWEEPIERRRRRGFAEGAEKKERRREGEKEKP